MMNGNAKLVQPVPDKCVWRLSFLTVGRVTVALPLGSLIVCFVSAVIFQFNEVNQTVCQVQNSVPSISAVTGVTPQRYIWRVCIALHSGPRFAIGFIYYHYYMQRAAALSSCSYRALVRLTFWIYTIENACLVGVTYIANVENYPLHEKIFIVFMVTVILYEILTLFVFSWAHPDMSQHPHLMMSYRLKKICFFLIASFTAGLLYYFFKHRLYCEPGAFTWFSSCEYGIAVVNILFHYTATWEFTDLSWCILDDCSPVSNLEKTVQNVNGTDLTSQQPATATEKNGNNNKKQN